MITVGILALQGNFREHLYAVQDLGFPAFLVRTRKDLDQVDALIFPGGESTAMTRILRAMNLIEPIDERIRAGMPCFGSCAGLILLSSRLTPADPRVHVFSALDISTQRNAFGRQEYSSECSLNIHGQHNGTHLVDAVFIRAPIIVESGSQVEVLARIESGSHSGAIVAARHDMHVVTAFHPEMTADRGFHRYFLDIASSYS